VDESHLDFEPERAKEGVEFELLLSPLSQREEKSVLRGLTSSGLLPFLRRHPLKMLALRYSLRYRGHEVRGLYNAHTRTVQLSLSRPPGSYAQPFVAGTAHAVSDSAPTALQAAQRSLVHEVCHHVIEAERQKLEHELLAAFLVGRPITRIAQDNWREYFCETYTAFVFHRTALKDYDPSGYATIMRVKERLDL